MKRWRDDVAGVAVLAGIWGVYFLPMLMSRDLLFGDDMISGYYILYDYVGRGMGDGSFWAREVFCGNPMLPFVWGSLYPLNWLFYVLPAQVGFNIFLPVHNLLAGLFTYALIRSFRLRPSAAVVGALAYQFSGRLVTLMQQPRLLAPTSYLPALLLAAVWILRTGKWRWVIFGAIVLALQFLVINPQIQFYSLLIVGSYVVCNVGFMVWGRGGSEEPGYARDARPPRRSKGEPENAREHEAHAGRKAWWRTAGVRLGQFAAAGVLALALVAPQLVETMTYSRLSSRGGGKDWEFASSFSYPPEEIASLFLKSPFGNWLNRADFFRKPWKTDLYAYGRYGFTSHAEYLGVVPLFLAIVGFAGRKRFPASRDGPPAIFLAVLAVMCFLFAIGRYGPVFPAMFHLVPGLARFRVPVRMLIGTELAVALLAGLGAAVLAEAVGRGGERGGEASRENRGRSRGRGGGRLARDTADTAVLHGEGGGTREARVLHGEGGDTRDTRVLHEEVGGVGGRGGNVAAMGTTLRHVAIAGGILAAAGVIVFAAFHVSPASVEGFFRIPSAEAWRRLDLGAVVPQDVWTVLVYIRKTVLEFLLVLAGAVAAAIGVLRLKDRRLRAACFAALPLLLVVDQGSLGRRFQHRIPVDNPYFAKDAIVETLIEESGMSRVLPLVGVATFLPNKPYLYGLESFSGYHAVVLKYYEEVLALGTSGVRRVLDMANVRHLVLAREMPPESGLELVRRVDDAWIYRNPGALPRAFLVDRARVIPERVQRLQYMASGSFDPAREIVLEEKPGRMPEAGEGSSGRVTLIEYGEGGAVRVRVMADRASFLFLSDTWYPEWRAYVDGRPVPILKANHAFRAVAIEAGEHVVEFRLRMTPTRRWVPFAG